MTKEKYAIRAPRRVLAVSAVAAVAAVNPDGFTVNAYTGETPAEGYAVALAETQDSHDAEGLARVLELIQSGTTRAAYVGGWLDRETGKYYYDATIVVNDRAEALAHCCRWHRNGRRHQLQDDSEKIRRVFNALRLSWTEGNDAPRGGREGDYIEITAAARRALAPVHADFKAWLYSKR